MIATCPARCASRVRAWLLARTSLAAAGALLAGATWLLAAPPVAAQGVKDLMGKAQTQSDQRAVEDLIRKLKGGGPAAPAVKAQPQAQPPVAEPVPQIAVRPTSPPPASVPPAAAEADATASPQQPLQAATPAVSRPPEPAPAAVPPRVEVATTDEMPSVDIEVYFDFRSHAVTPRAEATLVVLGKALSDQRLASAKFMIAGHTDAVGSATYNRELSERRAASVRRFLIERFGIDGSRLVSHGFGFDKLKVPARPKAVENRRVQIVNLTASAPR